MKITNQNYAKAIERGWFTAATDVRLNNLPSVTALADDGHYKLYRSLRGGYYAGCRIFTNATKALAHWDRSDKRAQLFSAAIRKIEG